MSPWPDGDGRGGRVAGGWRTRREAGHLLARPDQLCRTAATAALVGTILVVVNHPGVVFGGQVSAHRWLQVAVTYLVPFCVANVGILLASRQRPGSQRGLDAPPPSSQARSVTEQRGPSEG